MKVRLMTKHSSISLLTSFLVLALPHSVIAQTSQLEIKGITKTIEGRQLTIPDFENTSFESISNYRKQFESEITNFPELKDAPFTELELPKSFSPGLAIADNYWSQAEYSDSNITIDKYVSGSVTCSGQNKPMAPKSGQSISYLELAGSGYHGKRWVSGKQMVDGGCGILKAVNGGKEPAGRLVWGSDTFKIVLNEADETTQIASFSAYMRICADTLLGRTCTPYFIPLPWFPVSGNNWVVIGRGTL